MFRKVCILISVIIDSNAYSHRILKSPIGKRFILSGYFLNLFDHRVVFKNNYRKIPRNHIRIF